VSSKAEALAATRAEARRRWEAKTHADVYVTVGIGTCGLAAGAGDTLEAIQEELARRGLTAAISKVGCVGMCSYEPMVEIQASGKHRLNYGQVTPASVPEIFASYFDGAPLKESVIVGQALPTVTRRNGHALHSLSFVDPGTGDKIAFHQKQLRIVLSNCGLIDPESIDDYLALDGYRALEKVVTGMKPEEVIEEVTKSGLRGRGGAGFPMGFKWDFCRKSPGKVKYIMPT